MSKRESLIAALELMEFGILLMRQNIARALPNADAAHVDAELLRWVVEQPVSFIPKQLTSDGNG